MRLSSVLISGLCVTLWMMPIGSAFTESEIKHNAAEIQNEIEKLNSSFIDSPEVVSEIKRLEEKYPEQSGKGRYQEGGHQYTTYIVAMAAGLGRERSYKLSYYSQLPDDEIAFNAALAFFYFFNLEYRQEIMALLHSLHGGDKLSVEKRRNDLRDLIHEGIKDRSLSDKQIGLIIHAYADSYAHTMIKNGQLKAFDYTWGHLFHGNKPDLIVYDPEKYKEYTCELFKVLSSKGTCSPELDKLHEKIKGLETSRIKELPFFAILATKDYGYDSTLYKDNGKKWENTVSKDELIQTMKIIESKTSG